MLCDGVRLADIASAEGTPLYVYSAAMLRERFQAIDRAFGDYPHAVHYALKANSAFAIARLIHALGGAVDANSLGEIELARKAGFAAQDIVFTGVGKSQPELEAAVSLGLKAINVESAGELARVEAIAEQRRLVARVAIRVNPDIDAKSHPHISTGLKVNKFGIPVDEAHELFATLTRRPALRLVAVHVHVGSQITTLDPLRRAAAVVAELAQRLREMGVALEYVDAGGGLGISYDGAAIPSMTEYVGALIDAIGPSRLPIVVEPGRAIAGPSAVLLARVIDLKPRDATSDFAVLDAGMTELMRPALYGAFHRIEPLALTAAPPSRYELVGPVCESSDVVGRDRSLPTLQVGDLVAIRDAGAYGSAMASNYNRRSLPLEVMVDDGRWRVIRRRQTIEDMLLLERE